MMEISWIGLPFELKTMPIRVKEIDLKIKLFEDTTRIFKVIAKSKNKISIVLAYKKTPWVKNRTDRPPADI